MPVPRGTSLFIGAKPGLAKGVIGIIARPLEPPVSCVLGPHGARGVSAVPPVARKVLELEDAGSRPSPEKLGLVLEKLNKVSVNAYILRIVQVRSTLRWTVLYINLYSV